VPFKIPLINFSASARGMKSVRICFVRHGETKANLERVAAGRMHSPLTERGMQQARTLGDALEHLSFQKYVTSDMERARHTAQLVSPSSLFVLEPRLREMGKGAREGHPKIMTYKEALKERGIFPGNEKNLPLLESENQVWERVSFWLNALLNEVFISETIISVELYSILVITHAGVIRTLCSHLLSDKMPEGIDISNVGVNGSTERHLSIPNCSATVIKFSVPQNIDFTHPETSVLVQADKELELLCWKGKCTETLSRTITNT